MVNFTLYGFKSMKNYSFSLTTKEWCQNKIQASGQNRVYLGYFGTIPVILYEQMLKAILQF
jgi:hypothetical protein